MLTVDTPEVRELAGRWARELDEMAQAMYDRLAARIPEAAGHDPELAGLTLASCSSNIEAILSMIRHHIPVERTEAPVTALEHARAMAQRGAGVDATLRFYRLGHEYFWARWSATLAQLIHDHERLAAALEETALFLFEYIDIVSSQVAEEHLAERERLQRRAAVLRDDVVRGILAGEAVDRAAAERALNHPLTGAQRAFVCWATAADPGALEAVATDVGAALGSPRPLLVADGPQSFGGWVSPRGHVDEAAIDALLPDGVLVALGEVATGVDGFRRSREQADRARRVAELTGATAGAVRYADVALVDLLSADLDAARAFVAAELGPLAQDDASHAALRDTLRAVLAPQGGIAVAARALDLHRNTVLQRVHRAEALMGRPLAERPAELHAALLLAPVVGVQPAHSSGRQVR